MRETKDQKLTRLQKKTEDQYEEIKNLRREKKSIKTELENLKTELEKKDNLRNEVKVINEKETREISKLNTELVILKAENQRLKRDLEETWTKFKISCRELGIEDWNFGLNNLYQFLCGGMTDKLLNFFFDIDTLAPNIDLLSGEYINPIKRAAIIKELNEHPEYLEALEKVKPFKEKIRNQIYPEEYPLFLDICKGLIKYYCWIFFPPEITKGYDFNLEEWLYSNE